MRFIIFGNHTPPESARPTSMEKAPTSSCASDSGGEGLNKSLKAKFDHKCFDKFVFKQNSFREYGQKIGKNPFCLGIANLPRLRWTLCPPGSSKLI